MPSIILSIIPHFDKPGALSLDLLAMLMPNEHKTNAIQTLKPIKK